MEDLNTKAEEKIEQEPKEKPFEDSEPAPGTFFRSKIFTHDEMGRKYQRSAIAIREIPKLSKMEKKALKKAKVLKMKANK